MIPQRILLYYPFKTKERLDYIATHLLTGILGAEISITDSKSDFLTYSGPAINYSAEALAHGLHICPEGLLEEAGIQPRNNIEVSEWKELPCFFPCKKGDIPFDLFAASFYLLSRYEEYTSSKIDIHGRFDPVESLAYRNHFLEIPIIDRWAYVLKEELCLRYLDLTFPLRRFRFISTFDIDFPYQYQRKGLLKSVGALVKDAMRLNLKQVVERIIVHLSLKSDPYMKAIHRIEGFHQEMNKEYFLFILRGARGKYGRSTSLPLTDYYQYLKTLKTVVLGLHPSYETYKNLELLIREKQELEDILGREVASSRQHFLRISIPETFQELTIAGIRSDFSLAYAGMPGFRAGTAIPHRFYDLEKEQASDLFLYPTILMDTTLIRHWGLSPESALVKIKSLIDECFQSGGDYVSLWHNSNLAGKQKGNPWIDVFTDSSRYASALEKNT